MSTFLDSNEITLLESPSGLRHVKAWYGQTVCGKYCEDRSWSYKGLTNLRWLGRIAQRPQANRFCKTCAAVYKDVKYD